MNTLKTWMVAGSVLLVISAANPALGEQYHECSELRKEMLLAEHQKLYQYSLVAGVPSQQSNNFCSEMREESLWDLSGFNQTTSELIRRLDLEVPLFYLDQDDSPYIACSGDSQPPHWVFYKLWWKTFPEAPFLAVVVHVKFGRGAPILDEEIEFELLRNPGTHDGPETLVAIRGTNKSVLRQWITSFKDIFFSSCAFGLMVQIVERLPQPLSDNEPLVVVGHSLGGTAAQYIAQQAHENMRTLDAYAYGALGRGQNEVPSGRTVVSYHIDGDTVADKLSTLFGKHQIGRTVEYKPDPMWNSDRHSLRAIQGALCRCMTGSGSLSIQP